MATEPECKLCGNDQAWHRDRPELAHKFIPPDGSLAELNGKREKREEARPRPPLPGDPVLRIALLKAGIITPAQLEEAKHDFESGNPIIIVVNEPDLPVGVVSARRDQGDRG